VTGVTIFPPSVSNCVCWTLGLQTQRIAKKEFLKIKESKFSEGTIQKKQKIMVGYLLLAVYCICILFTTFYCIMQLDLLFWYRKPKKETLPILATYPTVTIQLPLFNEAYVSERLIDNIVKLDYPADKLEIQVLDDSNDETVGIVAAKVAEYQAKGVNIVHVRRPDRSGFKAGALRDGLKMTDSEFVAIFDADFLPKTDFLKQTIPHFFKDEKIGVVQTRWEHLNEDYSLITKLQAMQLNVHFTVEQAGRQRGGFWLQFNGTAGVWRRETIEDAGGWHSDTLTEDLDLSYRAQLKGWKIEFLEHVGTPSELPAEMNALKAQQFRWMKGGAENARKLLKLVWDAPLSTPQKVHATQHLMASGLFFAVLISAIVSVPLVYFIDGMIFDTKLFFVSLAGLFSIISLSMVANMQDYNLGGKTRLEKAVSMILIFPIFLSMSMGMSLHNAIAVWEGYSGRKSPFVRTPKVGLDGVKGAFSKGLYMPRNLPTSTIVEGFMSLYFIFGLYASIVTGVHEFQIFHGMLAFGFGAICFYSIRHHMIAQNA
jgi:cellulose synthase/poly-beta-1,6-N-acetylglucosamine synthase-like glycosyltransferase